MSFKTTIIALLACFTVWINSVNAESITLNDWTKDIKVELKNKGEKLLKDYKGWTVWGTLCSWINSKSDIIAVNYVYPSKKNKTGFDWDIIFFNVDTGKELKRINARNCAWAEFYKFSSWKEYLYYRNESNLARIRTDDGSFKKEFIQWNTRSVSVKDENEYFYSELTNQKNGWVNLIWVKNWKKTNIKQIHYSKLSESPYFIPFNWGKLVFSNENTGVYIYDVYSWKEQTRKDFQNFATIINNWLIEVRVWKPSKFGWVELVTYIKDLKDPKVDIPLDIYMKYWFGSSRTENEDGSYTYINNTSGYAIVFNPYTKTVTNISTEKTNYFYDSKKGNSANLIWILDDKIISVKWNKIYSYEK